MNPISIFLVDNITVVYFFYGLAFFTLGLALALAARRSSEFRFVQAIRPLAAFGLIHGAHEWVEMFQRMAMQMGTYTPTLAEEVARVVVLAISFLLLAAFGAALLAPPQVDRGRRYLPVAALALLWGFSLATALAALRPDVDQVLAIADVLARYTLAIPGAVLGAWALMVQQRTFREHGMARFGRDLVWCATALLLYGVVGQVFVPETSLFPSTVINSGQFLVWFGVPVQLFRGVMATVLAIYMLRALNAFELEGQRRLAEANQARLRAQAEALEAERRTSRERVRLNQELRQTARELALLLDLSNLLAAPAALPERLQRVLQEIVSSLGFPDSGLILLAERQTGAAQVQVAANFPAAAADPWLEQARDLGEQCVARQQVMCRHADGTVLAFDFEEALQRPQCHLFASPLTMLSLPLMVQQQVIGSLVLAQRATDQGVGVNVDELRLMLGIARQLGLSIENARLYQETQRRKQLLGDLLRQAVGAQERERQRIARELHDATGQSLTAIALGLRGIEGVLADDDGQDAALVGQIRALKSFSTEALGELRRIISDLRPSLLDDMGLAAALKWYVRDFEQRTAVPVTFEVGGSSVRLPAEYEAVLFRITQEALTNIARHAQAARAAVRLDISPTAVDLIVEDDGRGFDPVHASQDHEAGGGWGLLGIQERALLLGGECEIDSAPGRGARIRVTAPLAGEA